MVERWRETLTAAARGDRDRFLVVRSGERLIGFVSCGPGRDATQALIPDTELQALNVRAEAHGQGVGLALLQAAIGGASAHLWVLEGNHRAIRFYEKHGFVADGATKQDAVGLERRMVRHDGDH
ncbi:GNAT family N-acetyltransferase [Nocardioidaceae bacterium]|nr:GNAT family N-acetyltransferase [Nocardioidaceae bacterium]